MKTNKKLLMRVKYLISKTKTAEELYYLSTFTNMYINNPTRDNKELLEVYSDLIESSIELDLLEEKTEKMR